MDKYVADQLVSLTGQNIALMKFGETESTDGTVQEVKKDNEGDYLTLLQHEGEKILLSQIEEIYLLVDGYLPIYYSPLDDYDEENSFYPAEFFEAFYDFVGMKVKLYGKFKEGYELTGVLNDADPETLQLDVDGKLIELWRINIAFTEGEEEEWSYISTEELSEGFEEPLDNLYSLEDFEMLLGKKIRIKTMDPEIADEIATVSGYSLAEGYSGEEVFHLELEEFPDHILEPSEIQFIYLIGDDGSETLVEPSGGSLYHPADEEDEDNSTHDIEQESAFYSAYIKSISPASKPQSLEGGNYRLMSLTFSEAEFEKIASTIREWYIQGTPSSFRKETDNGIVLMDSSQQEEWYNQLAPAAAGYGQRPLANIPCILIKDTRITKGAEKATSGFAFYSITDIDKLNGDFGLGLKNYNLAVGSIYETQAPKQIDPLDFYKSAILKYKEHLKTYPRHIIALNNIGRNLYYLAKYEDALKYLEQALAQRPQWVTALANKIDVLIQLREWDKALATVDDAQNREPVHGEWQWFYARIYEQRGDKKLAKKYAEEAVKRGFSEADQLLSTLG